MIEDLIQQLIDRLDHRYVGKYRGYVHDVNDPQNCGRIRAIVPRLLGEQTPTGWALPAAPYAGPNQGFFAIPEPGAGVWIEFEEGDLSKPIWTGAWWGAPVTEDLGTPDSTARKPVPAAEQPPPLGAVGWTPPERTPETPQHEYPRQSPTPQVRVLKSASGHHIVLDDRPEFERIEIHDSKGNRLILSREGIDRIMSNERVFNKGSRASDVGGGDLLTVAGSQTETVGQNHTRTVGGDVRLTVAGNLNETIGDTGFVRTVDHTGVTVSIGGPLKEKIGGSVDRSVAGAISDTTVGGYGLTSAGGVNITSGGSVKIAGGIADLSLNVFSVDGLLGNVSINSKLGVMQLGGLTAISPMVLGDGLAIHLTVLAQVLKLINPLTLPAYGPAVDVWAAMTPLLDLSYFGFVKRFPVG
jgi:type VI secretion system secreted protein VgrG